LADDVQKAVEWYRKAAALGNDRAKNALIRLGK
jgi:TPR repeat protein